MRRVVSDPAACFRGLTASLCQDVVFLWELEAVDSSAGRCAVYTVAIGRPALLHLGTAKVRGEFIQLIKLIGVLLYSDSGSPV